MASPSLPVQALPMQFGSAPVGSMPAGPRTAADDIAIRQMLADRAGVSAPQGGAFDPLGMTEGPVVNPLFSAGSNNPLTPGIEMPLPPAREELPSVAPSAAPASLPPQDQPLGGIADIAPAPAPTGVAPSGVAAATPAAATPAAATPAAATSFEQEILNAIQRQERRAEQDKWLALAQVGLQMMSSTQPTFLGALGEAGSAGIQSLVGTRDANEARRMELVQALEEYRMMQADRSAAEAASRAAASRPAPGPSAPSLSDLQNRRDALVTTVENEFGEETEVPFPGYESQVMFLDQLIVQAAMAGLPQQPIANLSDVVGQ